MTIYEIINSLEKSCALYVELLELARKKKDVIIANDVPSLNQFVHKESLLVRRLAEVEEQRVDRVNQFLVSRCYKADSKVTISDLVKLLFKAEEKRALMNAQANLLAVTSELYLVNELNQRLIQQSMDYLNYSLDVLLGPDDSTDTTYRPSGHLACSRSGYFDTRQ